MKYSGYMTRAMKSRDPRYRIILAKLGYSVPEVVQEQPKPDELAELRAEYEAVIGRRPFMGWDAETLNERIAAAKACED